MKKIFDFITSLATLIILSPVMVVVAFFVNLKLGSPIIFKQERPGIYGKSFNLYKFRTMTDEKDSQGILLPNEKRMTKFGSLLRKTSLDELPQLFNVLKGDMSLVGPRPLLMDYLNLYTKEQARRNEVKPGITGWAQVNGRNALSWEEKFKLDVWYVDNKTFMLDMRILFLTVLKVLKKEGINQSEQVIVEKFRGNK